MEKIYENELSGISYTNLDFQTIYPELLELAKKISYKWDPTQSNESDPGVVLLKLCAIVGDKCNYNADKNTLECFPETVTQISNARMLFEQLGYTMKWYKSATTNATLQWSGDSPDIRVVYHIPQFSMVCDEDEKVVYTLLNEVSLDSDKSFTTCNIIQGVIQDYIINDNDVITIDNLDSNNRIYFSENNISTNGIFIINAGSIDENIGTWERLDEWIRVDNLSSQKPGTKCYKYGLSTNNNFYIEFPEDVAKLISGGIKIKYIVTDGEDGNVVKSQISKFYGDVQGYILNDDGTINNGTLLNSSNVVISNNSSALNGENPESIEQAYKNYKKTIGVFNTLVTLQDYEDAIYKSDYLCSNDVVTDRTNDIQSSWKIMTKANNVSTEYTQIASDPSNLYATWESSNSSDIITGFNLITYINKLNDEDGDLSKLMQPRTISNYYSDWGFSGVDDNSGSNIEVTLHNNEDKLTAFDLKLYLTKYVGTPSNSTQYNSTFDIYTDLFEGNASNDIISNVEAELYNNSSIQHNIKPLMVNKICLFKNKYPIKCRIVPQYKLTEKQIFDVKTNIKNSLYKHFNAREVNFGEEIDYNELYEVILNADTKIKNVFLDDIEYTTYAVYVDSSYIIHEVKISGDISTSQDVAALQKEIWAKSVLAGRTQLLEIDTETTYKPNQAVGGNSYIKSLSSETTIHKNVPLLENEKVYFTAQSYIDDTTFSNGVIYLYSGNQISQNSTHQLTSGEKLICLMSNDDDTNKYTFWQYAEGSYIKPSMTLTNNVSSNEYASIIISKCGNVQKGEITDSATISAIKSFRPTGILTATSTISIQRPAVENTSGKYFYYYIISNQTESDENNIMYKFSFTVNNNTATYTVGQNEYLICTDSSQSTLAIFGEGTKLSVSNVTGSEYYLTSPYTDYSNISEDGLNALDGIWTSIVKPIDIKEQQFIVLGKGCSITSLTGTSEIKNAPATISAATYTDENGTSINLPSVTGNWEVYSRLNINSAKEHPQTLSTGQTITLTFLDDSTEIIDEGNIFQLDPPVNSQGGENLDMSVSKFISDSPSEYVKAFWYTENEVSGVTTTDNYKTVHFSIPTEPIFTALNGCKLSPGDYIIPITTSADDVKVSYNGDSAFISPIDDTSTVSLPKGTHYLKLSIGASDAYSKGFVFSNATANVDFGPIYAYEDNSLMPLSSIIDEVKLYDPNKKFDYTYIVDPDIEIVNPLEATSFFNINHIFNKFVIPQIDTESFKDEKRFMVEQKIRG